MPEADPRQRQGRDRLDDHPGADPRRRRHPHRHPVFELTRSRRPTRCGSRSSASSGGGSTATTSTTTAQFDDIITANDLVIPAGREIALTHHVPRRDPQLLGAPRSTARRTRCPDRLHPLEARGRQARRVPRPVHRVLRPVPRRDAHQGRRPVRRTTSTAWAQDQQEPARRARRRRQLARGRATGVRRPACTSCHRINGVNDRASRQGKAVETGQIKYPKLSAGAGDAPEPHPPHEPHAPSPARSSTCARTPTECNALGVELGRHRGGPRRVPQPRRPRGVAPQPAGQKPMAPEASRAPAAAACRTCNLTEEQIDQLVAYLTHPEVEEPSMSLTTDLTARPLALATRASARVREPARRLRPAPHRAPAGAAGSPRSTTRRSASCTAPRRCSSSSSAASRRC